MDLDFQVLFWSLLTGMIGFKVGIEAKMSQISFIKFIPKPKFSLWRSRLAWIPVWTALLHFSYARIYDDYFKMYFLFYEILPIHGI